MRWTLGTKASSAQGRTCSEWPGQGGRPGRVCLGARRGPSLAGRLAGRLDCSSLLGCKKDRRSPLVNLQPSATRPQATSGSLSCPAGITGVIVGSRARRLQRPGPVQCRSSNWHLGSRGYNSTELSSPLPVQYPLPLSFLRQLSPSSVTPYPRPLYPDGNSPLGSTVDCR